MFEFYFLSSVALFSPLENFFQGNSSQKCAAGLTTMVVCGINRYVIKMRVSNLQSLLSVRAILVRFRKDLFCLSVSRFALGYYNVVILLQYPGTSQIHKTFRCQWLLIDSQVLQRASGRVADSSGSEYIELLTRWQPRYVSQNISTSYLVLGHHAFDRNLRFILTTPGCP